MHRTLAARLLHHVLRPLLTRTDRILLGIDDTPTQGYGPHVQGAGLHNNSTPGPSWATFVYGHSWVVLGWLARHPRWGTIALPLSARLDMRAETLPRIPAAHRPVFRTKLELAMQLVRWARNWMGWYCCWACWAKRASSRCGWKKFSRTACAMTLMGRCSTNGWKAFGNIRVKLDEYGI